MIQVKKTDESPGADTLSPRDLLANAVILQAVKDFRHARRRISRRPDDGWAVSTIKEIAHFFWSEYFTLLTRLDGPRLLDRLMKEGGNERQ